jgi:glycosyltransferase involved in cell wall biosynthesis
MPYLSTLGRIPNLHFISAFSRSEVVNRVLKKSSPRYTVIPLGADSLGQASPNFSASKRTFTYVGSIDPKRNHSVVLDAFKELWVENIDVQLTLIGRIRPDLASLAHELSNLQDTEPRFAWKRGLDDAAVSAIVKESRATIYVSEYEGFGLPPIESLALGTPSIVSRFVPSLESVGTAGTICVEIQKSAIRNAVLRMLDDDYAASKFAEISTLSIPTWKGYAHSLWSAITI